MSQGNYLYSFTQLSTVQSDEERTALFRQAMATLARAGLEQRPVPLEGIDPQLILQSVQVALKMGLFDELGWLSNAGAAAAIYELAASIPEGNERRALGRHALTRLYSGSAETFIVLARSLAAESRRMLTGAPIRARVSLALSLPIGDSTADSLALTLMARADLRQEWLIEPATGSLPSRRLAARLLERAAREAVRRALQGDAGSLRGFSGPRVSATWNTLLADRESLVWRHVATARGLLSHVVPEFREEMENHLDPALTPTEWRRAAVSWAATIALTPSESLTRCRAILGDERLKADTGLPGAMIHGLGQVAEQEPEFTEVLLETIAEHGGIDAAEALVDLRRELNNPDVGEAASKASRRTLQKLVSAQSLADDGKLALCRSLLQELERSPSSALGGMTLGPGSLQKSLDRAIAAFVESDAEEAFRRAQETFQAALAQVALLEQTNDESAEGRYQGFVALRELDLTLLQTAALSNLLSFGARNDTAKAAMAPLGVLFERLTTYLLRTEQRPATSGNIPHLTLRLRRLRTLLHLVDADGSLGEDVTGQRRTRRLRITQLLLQRTQQDALSPLRRTVCAALARSCDALIRDGICEISDVLVMLSEHVVQDYDLETLAEASMIDDLQRSISAYAALLKATREKAGSGSGARAAIDGINQLAQALPWASTLRVSALRKALLELASDLEVVASTSCVAAFGINNERAALGRLEHTVFALAQLTAGTRRRILGGSSRPVPASGSALSALDMFIEQRRKGELHSGLELSAMLDRVLHSELPMGVASALMRVLTRLLELPLLEGQQPRDSFSPPALREAPLPAWLPARRTIGGFYVVRALGHGGVGTVFVVVRGDERHRKNAPQFALKVPDYSAEAARTLSEDQFLAMFREEAGALLALPRHPNLATFVTFDAGARPKPILVMELVDGVTLERAIELRDMDTPAALHYLDGIAAGLQAMHRAGLGHLDVKPSNVILRRGEGGRPRSAVLVDFGLAGRQIRPGCATGSYGAPEVWGLIPSNFRPSPMGADVYAFACMIFETLTGETLFDGPSEMAVIHAHLQHDGMPARLTTLSQQPELLGLCKLVESGLRRHPANRQTVQGLRAGLGLLAPKLSQLSWPLSAREMAHTGS